MDDKGMMIKDEERAKKISPQQPRGNLLVFNSLQTGLQKHRFWPSKA